MPLVTLYVNQAVLEICGKPQLAAFHDFLAQKDMFATTPGILQVNLVQTANMHPNPNGVFVSIRCKGTKERTKEKLSSILQRAGEHLVKALGRDCKLRLECFEPDLQLAVKVAAKQEQAKL
ncbi:unnamed protein product [Amoebophrya sp. A25]|nr:unnamed protein product [Amoebophrya sp. A25]|eukprot:GSA25T00013805001.1